MQADAPLARVDWRALLHPLLYAGLRIAHLASGFRVTANGRAPRTRRPVIYAASHIGLYDVEAVLPAIRKHAYILSGDEEQMCRTLDGLLFDMNGVIYVDPEDSADKHVALQTAIRYLQSGRSLLWYPEGTWNLSPNVIIQPLYYGIIEAAYQAGALALSLGIAIQNFPEGAIISMPLRAEGMGKSRAFLGGVLSGVVEPVGAVLTILAAQLIVPALPYLLSFAAGAMFYVVVEELIPEMSQGKHSNIGTVFFAVGFSIMMVLDVALG